MIYLLSILTTTTIIIFIIIIIIIIAIINPTFGWTTISQMHRTLNGPQATR